LAELLYTLQLESDRLISVRPAEVQDFQAGILQFNRRGPAGRDTAVNRPLFEPEVTANLERAEESIQAQFLDK
jgi:hypothetical protein